MGFVPSCRNANSFGFLSTVTQITPVCIIIVITPQAYRNIHYLSDQGQTAPTTTP